MNRIKELLTEKSVTQTELARRLNLTKASITQLLTIGNPNLKTLESIASALSVPVWELLVSREEMKHDFSLDIYGVVLVNGGTRIIESVEDLESLILEVKKTPVNYAQLFEDKLNSFTSEEDREVLNVCFNNFGAQDTLEMLDICADNPTLALSILMRNKQDHQTKKTE